MHPSCALLVWLIALLAVQLLEYTGLAVGLLVLLLLPSLHAQWLLFIRRSRWLLLTLWLIIAYHTPGEAYQDMAWAPTYEGIAEANAQALRLVLMLGLLAWLFVRQGRAGLLAGLWGLLRPLHRPALDVERLVVRLSLVLEGLQRPGAGKDWRQMLGDAPDFSQGGTTVLVTVSPWRWRDSISLLAAFAVLGGLLLW